MGREIRRVTPDWEHPKRECRHLPPCQDCYQPLYDRDFDAAAGEWLEGLRKWEADEDGERTRAMREHGAQCRYFWEWGGSPPDRAHYRPSWTDAVRTHYQVYETVSEGTPVTPHFATKRRLVDYLVEHGDFWDQHRGHGGWLRANAERFVENQWAPSLIVLASAAGADIRGPRDGA